MSDSAPSVQSQISSMIDNGVRFELMSREEAAVFLSDRNFFFKVKAFDKNFSKYTKPDNSRYGQYIHLDFAYLVDLSRKDAILRESILDLALDLEHYLKVTVNRVLMETEISTRLLMRDFFNYSRSRALSEISRNIDKTVALEGASDLAACTQKLTQACKTNTDKGVLANLIAEIYDMAHGMNFGIDCNHVEKSFAHLGSSFYSRKLVEKYGDPDTMEPWHFMEMASFGDFISFYKYLFFDSEEKAHIGRCRNVAYDAATAKYIKKLLFPAKTLRNAAAHNDCLLNNLNGRLRKPIKQIKDALIDSHNLNKRSVERSWQVPAVHDFAALLISYDKVVPSGETRDRAAKTLRQVLEFTENNLAYYAAQEDVKNSLSILADLARCFSGHYSSNAPSMPEAHRGRWQRS